MQGKEAREEAYFRPADWWEEQSIELLTRTSVLRFDAADREARLSHRQTVAFEQALLATGANVRVLHVDGGRLEGLHYLRTLGNVDAIVADAEDAERVVLIGGSYIGTEVAASLTLRGKRCSILMQEAVTLESGFGARAGRFFQGVLEEHGIEVHGDDALARFEGSDGRVKKVVTERGKELEADLVVIGAGVHPEVTLAKSAGLELGERGGIRCTAQLETSAPGVYAAGDVCEYDSPVHGRPVRIEHWDVAFNHGRTAALNMLGKAQPHDVVPYFFSDLADWSSMEYVGPAYRWDEEVVRGSMEDGEFSIWYLQGGRLAAALSVGRSDDLEHARRLITEGADVSQRQAALGDVESELGEL
jgi:3-phenylpropionate/trans-cinnamate dioxygenase ferredoxin reductase subunit